jgi:hypothetical protein
MKIKINKNVRKGLKFAIIFALCMSTITTITFTDLHFTVPGIKYIRSLAGVFVLFTQALPLFILMTRFESKLALFLMALQYNFTIALIGYYLADEKEARVTYMKATIASLIVLVILSLLPVLLYRSSP